MAINFTAGDIVVVKQTYVQNTLGKISPVTSMGIVGNNIKRTVSLLGQFKHDPIEVLGSGSVTGITDNALPIVWSFIRIRPVNQQSPSYQSGAGIIIYWHDDTGINDALELSSAYVKDSQAIRCKNTSGVTIFKSAVVYSTGFDTASNLPTVALASAASSNTLAAFGLAEEEIIDGAFGTVIIDGHYQGLNTLAFNINDIVYLSDTPGQVSASQGTSPSIVGRCINIGANDGAIAFRGIIPLGQGVGGGGPGPQGATGIQGVTGLSGTAGAQGATGSQGVQGTQGIQGSTGVGIQGIQGTTGMMGLGTTGVQGIQGEQGFTGLQGIQGIQGTQGNTGIQGTQGVTGILGIDGVTGIAGINGATGIQGLTGLAGVTGIGIGDTFIIRDTFTGVVTNGQTMFTLSMTPSDTTLVTMEVNGVDYRSTTFLTISGTTLTWLDTFVLSSSDVVDIVYPIPLT
jgi:hypothetical protein